MELHILEHRLRVASIAKESIQLFTYGLIKLAFLSSKTRCKFFSLTETPEDYTIIVDEEGFLGNCHSSSAYQTQCKSWKSLTHLDNHTSSEITPLCYDLQGHLIAMELSSGEEYYVACDNTGTPLAVFSSRGQVIKEILYTPYGEIYQDTNPDFQVIIGFHGGLYDSLTKLVHLGQRDCDVIAGWGTTTNHHTWKHLNAVPQPFNLYSFENNYPVGRIQDVAKYTTGFSLWKIRTFLSQAPI